jgi:hypothetical protein
MKASEGVGCDHVAAKQYGTRCQKARSARFTGFCRLFSENPQKDFLPQKVPPNSRLFLAYWRLISNGLRFAFLLKPQSSLCLENSGKKAYYRRNQLKTVL